MKADIWWDGRERSTKLTLLEPIDVEGWTVPAGYVSDGSSIPRAFWAWLDPLDARYVKVFVWHDWAYDEGIFPREHVDGMMRQYLVRAGMRRSQAAVIYWMVTLFGGSHYALCN